MVQKCKSWTIQPGKFKNLLIFTRELALEIITGPNEANFYSNTNFFRAIVGALIAKGYRLDSGQIIDFSIHTFHVEITDHLKTRLKALGLGDLLDFRKQQLISKSLDEEYDQLLENTRWSVHTIREAYCYNSEVLKSTHDPQERNAADIKLAQEFRAFIDRYDL